MGGVPTNGTSMPTSIGLSRRGGGGADGVRSVAAARPYPSPPPRNADWEAERDGVLSAALATATRITAQPLKVSRRVMVVVPGR
jgi:hypothetical protein